LYDGHWIAGHRDELERGFEGAVVLADNHYGKAKEVLKKLKFHVNFALSKSAEPPSKGGPKPEDTIENLTKERKAYNKEHSHGRARAESPFGLIKLEFASLAFKWADPPEQQVYLVRIAAAIHNIIRSH
jgi:hypothetical protein